jgi:apolipoprotein N-acyltransferase
VIARLERRAPERRVLSVGMGALAVTLAYGAVRLRMVDANAQAADGARVGVVQANMGLMAKRLNAYEGVKRHRDLTTALKRENNIDFVVWSESAVMWMFPEDSAESMLRDRVTSSLGVPAVFGAVVYRPSPERERERHFNTSFSSDEKGKITARYDKQFLLMFGEYLPFGETFPILHRWSPNSGRFSAGTSLEPLLVPLKGQTRKISMLICYEDILPSFVRAAVRHADPDLLVNITNDAWFGDTTEPWIHLALAKMRAIEHRRYLLRSTNSGVSAVIDPVGRVVAHSGTFRQETVDAVAHWMKGPRTGYEIWGDIPWWLGTAAIAFMAFRKRRPLT